MELSEHQGCWGSVPTRRRSDTHRKSRANLHIFANDTFFLRSEDSDEQFSEQGSCDPNRKKVNNIKIVVLKNSSVNGFEMDDQHNGVTRLVSSNSSSQRSRSPELRRCTDGFPPPGSRKNLTSEKRHLPRMPISSDDPSDQKNSDDHKSCQIGKSSSGLTESKLRKMKLKVGGITHTLQAETKAESGAAVNTYPDNKLKLINKDQGNTNKEILPRAENLVSVRKGKRVRKNNCVGETFDDVDAKQNAHLTRLKRPKDDSLTYTKDVIDKSISNKKKSRILKKRKAGYYEDDDYAICNSKRSRERDNGQGCTVASDSKEIMDKDIPCSSIEKEFSLVTRRRALLSSGGVAGGAIEFPNGLPSPPRRQKAQLSEVERQLKKAEAVQRRKLQLEKAARESEAEAIRKILGHDSSKKRDDKLRQKLRRAQEREAKSSTLPPDCVRWVIGPTGTTVTFPEGADLPSILNSKSCSYPPPREKCAGPSCSNPYKYRDSKTNLPLCSLRCYRAVRQDDQPFCVC